MGKVLLREEKTELLFNILTVDITAGNFENVILRLTKEKKQNKLTLRNKEFKIVNYGSTQKSKKNRERTPKSL